MVDIVIPIYKSKPDSDDIIALNQVFDVLKERDFTFIYPEKLNVSYYEINYNQSKFIAFEDFYFADIFGYNQLMLSKKLYDSFYKKYILIYQTDAFVFKNELDFWIEKNYDYIGAPWLRSHEKIPFIKLFLEKLSANFKILINFKGNRKIQKDKSLTYNEVGNGGFSLRKREKFIEILDKIPEVASIYLKNYGDFYNEDIFCSIEPKRNNIPFSKPNFKEACLFSIENKQEKALKYNGGKLPFGCHRWNKERDFWRKYFADFGYKI